MNPDSLVLQMLIERQAEIRQLRDEVARLTDQLAQAEEAR